MKNYEKTASYLATLKLKGLEKSLDASLADAEEKKVSYLGFLNMLLEKEISDRVEKKQKRNMTGAHFPIEKSFDAFEFARVRGMTQSVVNELLDFRWVDKRENLLFFGPPGLGKTHLAISFGIKAVHAGYTVCFERIVNLVKLLKTAEIQKTSEHRLNRILKSNLLIIDEIGYILTSF